MIRLLVCDTLPWPLLPLRSLLPDTWWLTCAHLTQTRRGRGSTHHSRRRHRLCTMRQLGETTLSGSSDRSPLIAMWIWNSSLRKPSSSPTAARRLTPAVLS